MHHYYYCDRCRLSWRFDSARAMAEFGTRHVRECPVWTIPSFDNGAQEDDADE